MKKNRFHPFYSVKLMQRYWMILLLPLLNALYRFDWEALMNAVTTQLVMLCVMSALSLALWSNAFWILDGDCLTVSGGFWWRMVTTVQIQELSCVELYRKPMQRLLGATQINLYFAHRTGSLMLYLPKGDAKRLADRLLPQPGAEAVCYRPTGFDRVGLAAVSGNLMAFAAMAVVTYNSTVKALRKVEFLQYELLETYARSQLSYISSLIAQILPTGLAWVITLFLLLLLIGGLESTLRTARFAVYSNEQAVCTHSGVLTLLERRFRRCSLTCVERQCTLLSWVTRLYPVYLRAGGFTKSDVPFFLYRKKTQEDLEVLLPGVHFPEKIAHPKLKDRSLVAFLALPGGLLVMLLIFIAVSRWALPYITPILSLIALVVTLWLLFHVEAFFRENLLCLPDGRLLAHFTTGMRHRDALILTRDVGYRLSQTPYNAPYHRGNVSLFLPAGLRLRLRSVVREDFEAQMKPIQEGMNFRDKNCDL